MLGEDAADDDDRLEEAGDSGLEARGGCGDSSGLADAFDIGNSFAASAVSLPALRRRAQGSLLQEAQRRCAHLSGQDSPIKSPRHSAIVPLLNSVRVR